MLLADADDAVVVRLAAPHAAAAAAALAAAEAFARGCAYHGALLMVGRGMVAVGEGLGDVAQVGADTVHTHTLTHTHTVHTHTHAKAVPAPLMLLLTPLCVVHPSLSFYPHPHLQPSGGCWPSPPGGIPHCHRGDAPSEHCHG